MFPAINKLSGLKSFMENVARYIIQTKNNFNRDPLNYLLLFLVTIKFIFYKSKSDSTSSMSLRTKGSLSTTRLLKTNPYCWRRLTVLIFLSAGSSTKNKTDASCLGGLWITPNTFCHDVMIAIAIHFSSLSDAFLIRRHLVRITESVSWYMTRSSKRYKYSWGEDTEVTTSVFNLSPNFAQNEFSLARDRCAGFLNICLDSTRFLSYSLHY